MNIPDEAIEAARGNMSARDNVYFNTNVGDLIVTMKTSGDFIISHGPIENGGVGGIRITAQEFEGLAKLFESRKQS